VLIWWINRSIPPHCHLWSRSFSTQNVANAEHISWTYRRLLLYALSLPMFSHIRDFISVSWRASISYPWLRYTLPRRPSELRAQFHWLAPPFWLRGLQIKASHGVSLRKSIYIYIYIHTRWFAATQPRVKRVTCISISYITYIIWTWIPDNMTFHDFHQCFQAYVTTIPSNRPRHASKSLPTHH
jgi:hypothetical protein